MLHATYVDDIEYNIMGCLTSDKIQQLKNSESKHIVDDCSERLFSLIILKYWLCFLVKRL